MALVFVYNSKLNYQTNYIRLIFEHRIYIYIVEVDMYVHVIYCADLPLGKLFETLRRFVQHINTSNTHILTIYLSLNRYRLNRNRVFSLK